MAIPTTHCPEHEFSLDDLEKAIRTAADVEHAGNVVIKMAEK